MLGTTLASALMAADSFCGDGRPTRGRQRSVRGSCQGVPATYPAALQPTRTGSLCDDWTAAAARKNVGILQAIWQQPQHIICVGRWHARRRRERGGGATTHVAVPLLRDPVPRRAVDRRHLDQRSFAASNAEDVRGSSGHSYLAAQTAAMQKGAVCAERGRRLYRAHASKRTDSSASYEPPRVGTPRRTRWTPRRA